MPCCRSIYVKKIMKLLAFIFEQPSYFLERTLNGCILMEIPIHIDTVSIGLPIMYLKGSEVENSKL